MRLAAISDIHGNSDALDAVLADIRRRGIETVVNLGDSFSGPLDPAGTAERLETLDLPTVRGNHDRLLVDRPVEDMGAWEQWAIGDLSQATLEWIRSLPLTLTIEDVFLCHATPQRDDENWLNHRGADHRISARELTAIEPLAAGISASMILCGHTHTPRSVRLPDGRRIVNPGSVGCPAYRDTRMEPNFIHQEGAPDARYAIVERIDDDWIVDLVSVPYDASRMIEHARARGAATWAQALETGWFV